MWHRARGHWLGWRWEDVLRDVTALAGVLHGSGIGAGGRVSLCSESRPEALMALLACDWLGAIPVTGRGEIAIAETAEDADALRTAGHAGPVLVIEKVPGLTNLAAALAEAAPAPPAARLSPRSVGTVGPAMHGFCQASLLDAAEFRANVLPLLRDGGTLSFPERPDTAAADLGAVRPERFSATAAQWQALHGALARTVPPRRLSWPFAARRLRRRLGFDRARLLLAHGGPVAPATAAFLAGIGLALTEVAGDAVSR